MIFGNTDRSESAVCPCDDVSMIVGCCFVTVNVRVNIVGVAVEVICIGSRSIASDLMVGSAFTTVMAGPFFDRSRALLLIKNSQSKSKIEIKVRLPSLSTLPSSVVCF